MTPNSEISFGHNGTEKHWYRHNTTTNLYNFSARIFLDRLRKLILTKFGRSGRKYCKYHAKRPPELVGTVPKLWKMIENEPICHFPGWESVQMNLIVSVYRLETLPDPKTHPRNSKNSKQRKSENRKIGRLSQNFSRQQYHLISWPFRVILRFPTYGHFWMSLPVSCSDPPEEMYTNCFRQP